MHCMQKISWFLCLILIGGSAAHAQKKTADDSLAYYDDLFSELELFLDSITAPRTFYNAGVSISNNYFNFQNGTQQVTADRRITYSPTVGFFHKSGFGFSAAASAINITDKFLFYQGLLTASYDRISNKLSTGISATRYFTKDSLQFYTSPLQNEVSAYVTYRKWWLRPLVSATYGWGSRKAYSEREDIFTIIKEKNKNRGRGNSGTGGTIPITQVTESTEALKDFSVTASVRHDFYWLHVLTTNNTMRVTPQLTLTSGTQRFGFNQTSATYASSKLSGSNVLFNTENVALDETAPFRPLSLTAFLKTEASFGKFYVQPQVLFDYYFPANTNKFNTAFTVNTGFMF